MPMQNKAGNNLTFYRPSLKCLCIILMVPFQSSHCHCHNQDKIFYFKLIRTNCETMNFEYNFHIMNVIFVRLAFSQSN